MLELMAQALRALPAGAPPPAQAAQAAALVPQPPGRTLADWLTMYEKVIGERGYKPQTLKNRASNIAHVRRLWGAQALADIKPHHVSTALREFLPDRSSTAVRVLAELRDVYTEAIANGWAETSPAAHVKPPRHRVLRKRLTVDVWQRMRVLAQASNQRWLECLLLLALAIGQRRADLAKVRFDDIVTDADGAQYLRIEQQKEAGKGYGARVEIPLALRLDCIAMTVGEVIERCRACGKPGPTLLRQANGRPIEVSSLSTRFGECYRAVMGGADPGAKLRPTLHEARSLAARCYVAQGMQPATVQTLLGHKDMDMTDMYLDDRGLTSREWKRVAVSKTQPENAA